MRKEAMIIYRFTITAAKLCASPCLGVCKEAFQSVLHYAVPMSIRATKPDFRMLNSIEFHIEPHHLRRVTPCEAATVMTTLDDQCVAGCILCYRNEIKFTAPASEQEKACASNVVQRITIYFVNLLVVPAIFLVCLFLVTCKA